MVSGSLARSLVYLMFSARVKSCILSLILSFTIDYIDDAIFYSFTCCWFQNPGIIIKGVSISTVTTVDN